MVKCTALEVAVSLGLVIVPSTERVLWHLDPVLWVGPGASEDAIVTIACSRFVKARGRAGSEGLVARLVKREGFRFITHAELVQSHLRAPQQEHCSRLLAGV